MANRTKVTDEKKAEFLELIAETGGNITRAARATSISRVEWYRTKWEDEEFSKQWDEAVVLGTASLEDEVLRRAKDGVEEPVFYQGEECGTIRRYSDTLAIFLLKARDPEKYKDRMVSEHKFNIEEARDELRRKFDSIAQARAEGEVPQQPE